MTKIRLLLGDAVSSFGIWLLGKGMRIAGRVDDYPPPDNPQVLEIRFKESDWMKDAINAKQ